MRIIFVNLHSILILFYGIEICIGAIGVEAFIAVHHCYQVLLFALVYDVVGIAREHWQSLSI